jgi:hypothetical protein
MEIEEKKDEPEYYNKYKKLVLNTSSEMKFVKIKSTFLCSEAKRKCKENISKYYLLGKPIQTEAVTSKKDNLFTLKVVYHDKTFNKKIKNLSNYNEFFSILTPQDDLISHIPLIKKPLVNDDNVIFDSDFEEGNLRMAIEINQNKEYDLIMRPEIGAKKLYTWFFFSVLVKNENKNINENILKLNVINKPKDKNFINGQCPVLMFDSSLNKWTRNTFNVYIINNGIKNANLKNEYKSYYSLTFSFNYKPNVKYYFASCYPYTYTQLRLYLNTLNKNCYNDIIKFGIIGKTYNKNNIPYITITNFFSSKKEIAERKCIFITGRIHSGETVSSYVVQGLIDFLVNLNNPISKYLRDKFIFKIIPMLNVDGVIYGNYRLNLLGKDMNRLWMPSLASSPDECDQSSLYINSIISMIKKTINCRNIFFYCDFHGHSGKQNFFLYGCPKEGNENFHKKFMEIYSKKSNIFSLNDCVHKIMPNKMNTCRALLKNQFNIDLSYCLETSMFSYVLKGENDSKKIYPFTIERYKQIGMDFCLTLFDFINPQNEENNGNEQNDENKNIIKENNKIEIKKDIMNNSSVCFNKKKNKKRSLNNSSIILDDNNNSNNNELNKTFNNNKNKKETEESYDKLNINKYFII